MALPAIYTIGVYGATEKEFFEKLASIKIDHFIDTRRRRAVRGSRYAFVNSKRLQARLAELGIGYLHVLALAPTATMIRLQAQTDEKNKIARRNRQVLSESFKKIYNNDILSTFDASSFMEELIQKGAKKIILFCVEKQASACHRSLVTEHIRRLYPEIKILHL